MTGEFAAIAAIRSKLPEPADPRQLWIGDDAAILPAPAGEWLLFAADTVVVGVHADLALTSLADLGWKALMAAVSDLAAMGADPGYALVTIAGPASTDLAQLYDGLGPAAAACGCPIVGGDLTNAPELVLTVAVTGSCPGEPVRRSRAQPGDAVWVTGPLGAAAAGLRRYRARAAGEPGADRDGELWRAHARPTANLVGGRAARLVGARAMIDISDGLTADLGHLAASSGVGMQLDRVPVADGATLEEALGGGEDFALAFCTPPDAAVLEAFASLPAPARIGTCTSEAGRLVLNGRPLEPTGWEHQW